MPPSKGDSAGSKNLKTGAKRRGRVSWGVILLGAALLACALALYLYAASNSPRTWRESDDLDNINRVAPAAATPTNTPAPKGDANRPR